MEEEKTIALSLTLKSFLLGWGMVLVYVILNSYGALILKSQIQKLGEWNFVTARSYAAYFLALLTSWRAWLGLGALFVSTGTWIVALANLELSKAYPVAIALNLLVIVGLSIVYNQESLTYSKILGVVLITTGAIALFK